MKARRALKRYQQAKVQRKLKKALKKWDAILKPEVEAIKRAERIDASDLSLIVR